MIHSFDSVAVLREGRLVKFMESSEAIEIVKPIYRIHIRGGDGWKTYSTTSLFEKLRELYDLGYDIKNAWVEEPNAEELLRAIGG